MRTLALLHVLTLVVSSANSNNQQSRPGPLWVTGGARKILYIISQISLYEMQSSEMIQFSSILFHPGEPMQRRQRPPLQQVTNSSQKK